MSNKNSKVVFVGNVPYNMTEEQLVEFFKSVGQVVGFRLLFDRDTGKPKGYGFCEFADHESALSAVQNLNNHKVGGRPLRIDLADLDPFLEGRTTVRGKIPDDGHSGAGGDSCNDDIDAFLVTVPPGTQLENGTSALDSISKTLSTMPHNKLIEVLALIKAFIITHPDQARTLLAKHPQLSYALFQALLMTKIVDSDILNRMVVSSGGTSTVLVALSARQVASPPVANRPPLPALLPHLQHHGPNAQYTPRMPPCPPQGILQPQLVPARKPPINMSTWSPSAIFGHLQSDLVPQAAHLPTQAHFSRPPEHPAAVQVQTLPVAPQQPALTLPKPVAPEFSEAQRTMLMQVLNLTQEQIDSLAEREQTAIMQLRKRFIGTL